MSEAPPPSPTATPPAPASLPATAITPFMEGLLDSLIKERGSAQSTALLYLRYLKMLNGGRVFKNLSFLRNVEAVLEKISGYADATQKTILAGIVAVLSLFKDSRGYKKAYDRYRELMMERVNKSKEIDTSEKTEKQKESWISWDDVLKRKEELKEKVEAVTTRPLTPKQYEDLLSYFLLSLYTDLPPRRNQDYSQCWVIGKWNESMPTDKNYYCVSSNRFIFNRYKTAKDYATQIIPLEDAPELKAVMERYLLNHPLRKGRLTKTTTFPLLVKADGKPMTAINAITRQLNKILGSKVGSSMLRHIYLSQKYGSLLEEQKEDASMMGHSVATQKEYIKTD